MAGARGALDRSWRRWIWMVSVLALGAVAPAAPATSARDAESVAATDYAPVPQVECGPTDRPESDLQGRVPPGERAAGFGGFDCNAELIGQFLGEGAGIQLAAFRHCAYYHTDDSEGTRGVVVVDVSNPSNPVPTAFLTEPAMADPWESLKVHPRRGLLAAVESDADGFSIYDVSRDCTQPRLLDTIRVPGAEGHAGNFSEDGQTYYGAGFNGTIYALDVSNPRAVEPVHTFSPPTGIHDLSTNWDGSLLYVADAARVTGVRNATNGLVVLDVSDIKARVSEPEVREVSTLHWDDGAIAQMTQLVHIGGKPHLIFADENGSGGLHGWAAACAAGLPPFGFARIIDISDPANPRLVSKLPLEVHDPANCPVVVSDTAGVAIFSYDSHYCAVDDPRNAQVLACSYYEAGLRVFDIRDPANPKEIAYYNPPANIGRQPGGASYIGAGAVQWHLSMPQVRLGECQVWITTTHSGLQVLQLTDNAWAGCPASTPAGGDRQRAEVGSSPLAPLIADAQRAGVGGGFCIISDAR